jgi:RND family efflux transporter MFP subunit
MRKYIRIVVPVFAILLLFVVYRIFSSGDGSDTRRQNIPLVKIGKPSRDTMRYVLEFTGDMVAARQANIFSKVGGNLEKVYVDMGAEVRQGQLLALIDTTELFLQYQQASATFENARVSFERTRDLVEQNLVSKQDLDNAEAAMKVARAASETAKTRLRYAWITAPFPGFVTRRYLDPGALVNINSSTLFTLMDLAMTKVIINLLEKDIPLVTVGKKASVTVDAFPGKEFLGSVTRYSDAVDLSTRTMAVEINIPNRDHLLKPGMFANVSLVVDTHDNALNLPAEAILRDDGGTYVFVINKDLARKTRITTGIVEEDRTEVLSGLDGTEEVITTGQQFCKDGGQVSVQN